MFKYANSKLYFVTFLQLNEGSAPDPKTRILGFFLYCAFNIRCPPRLNVIIELSLRVQATYKQNCKFLAHLEVS